MQKFAVKMLKNKYFAINVPDGANLSDGDMVLVRTEKGEEATKAILINDEVMQIWEKNKMETLPLIRKMGEADLKQLEEIKMLEIEAFKICQDFVNKRNLVMNLVECRYTFDKRKISFYYTAPDRVDFRELLKDLTATFKRVRIDLRHIGVRDETSLMTGCGPCGRDYCCCTWKRKFDSINIKVVRDQGMPITPSKISGACGRLFCCMNYEYKTYIEAAKQMPPVGASVMTPDGVGKICSLNFLNKKVSVKLEDGKITEYNSSAVETIDTDLNIDISSDNYNYTEASDEHIDVKQLEDDRNSSTGNV